MGYTRQSVAIAFELLGLLALESGMTIRFIIFIILGSLFHKSALVLLLFCTITNQEFLSEFLRVLHSYSRLFLSLARLTGSTLPIEMTLLGLFTDIMETIPTILPKVLLYVYS